MASYGRSAYDVAQGGLGGEMHRAIVLEEVGSGIESLIAEFEHDDSDAAREIVEAARSLEHLLPLVSITDAAELTFNRECSRCSGTGDKTVASRPGELDRCHECGGRGYVHASEADG